MGALGDALAAYVQPLIDKTDGSKKQVERAFSLGQICWNLAVAPEDSREKLLASTQQTLHMSDEEFSEMMTTIILPMIQRYYDMFENNPAAAMPNTSWDASPRTTDMAIGGQSELYPKISRNAPCPCHSGKKYKQCCGRMN